jgi:hypothetical protein
MNTAVGVGGGLGLTSSNAEMSIDMCDFRNNSAEVAGEINIDSICLIRREYISIMKMSFSIQCVHSIYLSLFC